MGEAGYFSRNSVFFCRTCCQTSSMRIENTRNSGLPHIHPLDLNEMLIKQSYGNYVTDKSVRCSLISRQDGGPI